MPLCTIKVSGRLSFGERLVTQRSPIGDFITYERLCAIPILAPTYDVRFHLPQVDANLGEASAQLQPDFGLLDECQCVLYVNAMVSNRLFDL